MWETVFNVEMICLIAGPIIALLVSAFKGVSLVQRHPKVVAALLSAIIPAVSAFTWHGLDWAQLAACLLVPFTTAVATYEVAIKPVTKGDGLT